MWLFDGEGGSSRAQASAASTERRESCRIHHVQSGTAPSAVPPPCISAGLAHFGARATASGPTFTCTCCCEHSEKRHRHQTLNPAFGTPPCPAGKPVLATSPPGCSQARRPPPAWRSVTASTMLSASTYVPLPPAPCTPQHQLVVCIPNINQASSYRMRCPYSPMQHRAGAP